MSLCLKNLSLTREAMVQKGLELPCWINSVKWASDDLKKHPFKNIFCTERTHASGAALPIASNFWESLVGNLA